RGALLHQFQGELQVGLLVLRKRDRVLTRIAGRTIRSAALADRRHQTFKTEVTERVGADIFPDFLERVGRGDELRPFRRNDAVKTARDRRGATNPHVYFARPGGTHHLHDFSARRPADERVVDEDDATTLQNALHRVELDPDAEMTDRLLRLDERPADV